MAAPPGEWNLYICTLKSDHGHVPSVEFGEYGLWIEKPFGLSNIACCEPCSDRAGTCSVLGRYEQITFLCTRLTCQATLGDRRWHNLLRVLVCCCDAKLTNMSYYTVLFHVFVYTLSADADLAGLCRPLPDGSSERSSATALNFFIAITACATACNNQKHPLWTVRKKELDTLEDYRRQQLN